MKSKNVIFWLGALVTAQSAFSAAVISGDSASLVSAVDSAQPGDTVYVPEGVYELTAQLEITKAISLLAIGSSENTVLKRIGWTEDTSRHED